MKKLQQQDSRCKGVGCKQKKECARYQSFKNDFLDFATPITNFTPNQDGTCSHKIDG